MAEIGDNGGDARGLLMTGFQAPDIEAARAAIRALARTYRHWLAVGRGFASGRADSLRIAGPTTCTRKTMSSNSADG